MSCLPEGQFRPDYLRRIFEGKETKEGLEMKVEARARFQGKAGSSLCATLGAQEDSLGVRRDCPIPLEPGELRQEQHHGPSHSTASWPARCSRVGH